MFYSIVQFSKTLVFCLGSDLPMHSLGVSPRAYKQLFGIIFLSSFFSAFFQTLLGPRSPHIPGFFFARKLAFVFPLCDTLPAILSASGAKWQEDRERKMKQDSPAIPCSWDHSSSGHKGFPFLRVLCAYLANTAIL